MHIHHIRVCDVHKTLRHAAFTLVEPHQSGPNPSHSAELQFPISSHSPRRSYTLAAQSKSGKVIMLILMSYGGFRPEGMRWNFVAAKSRTLNRNICGPDGRHHLRSSAITEQRNETVGICRSVELPWHHCYDKRQTDRRTDRRDGRTSGVPFDRK